MESTLNLWLQLPWEARLVFLFACGLWAGCFANWMIYTFAYNRRAISPWAAPHPDAPPRLVTDRLPVLGWLGMRREQSLHGRWFWIRPVLIELGLAAGFALLYAFEVRGGLLPSECRSELWLKALQLPLHLNFVSHAILLVLMTVATFIDFDEQLIPDAITLPGTLLGLLLSSFSLYFFLPGVAGLNPTIIAPVLCSSPGVMDPRWTQTDGLWMGLAIVAMWCFALADRRVIVRHGWSKAIPYFFIRMFRRTHWRLLLAVGALTSLWVVVCWSVGGATWAGALSSLIGLAIGGAVVWSVRIAAGWAMGIEAMGFGDVILLGMIGTYLGWQASLLAFFLAPFTALFIVLIYYLITGENRVAFGPYLCAGTLVTILLWNRLWNPPGGLAKIFFEWQILLAVLVVGVAIMGFVMRLLRLFRSLREG